MSNNKMVKKLGRNQPCWCGSGKKYKKCHLHKHQEDPIPLWQVGNRLKQSFSAKYCLCPERLKYECSGKIIKAHTVSKRSSLKPISRDGHVYGVIPSLEKIAENKGVLIPECIGINNASTFTGFCSVHDKSLFSAFEDKPFTGTPEQIFLIGYRSLSREYFTKTSRSNSQDILKELDRGRNAEQQHMIQKLAFLNSIGLNIGLRDLEFHKSCFDEVLMSKNFRSVRGYVIKFDGIIPITCSGAIYPEVDFHGNRLQDLSDMEKILDNLCFSIIGSEGNSYAVFTWLKENSLSCKKLTESLMSVGEKHLFSSLLRFAFCFFENTFISPDWWESRSEEQQQSISEMLAYGTDPAAPPPSNMLTNSRCDFGFYGVKDQHQVNTS